MLAIAAFLGDAPPRDDNCGAYCLYVSLRALDVEVGGFDALQQKLGSPGRTGYSLGQIAEVAEAYGVQTLGVKTTPEDLRLREAPFACIALIRESHFVNFAEIDESQVHVVDPPREYTLPLATLSTVWKGEALLLSRGPLVSETDLARKVWMFRAAVIAVCTLLLVALCWGTVRWRRRN
ncbi:MAG: cysteine peptidase family C39 domain-containing protein [Planctomycetales bacterium]